MFFARASRLFFLAGFLALFAFTGDIVADAVADARGDHCPSESVPSDSTHQKAPCSHCSCAVHNGAVIASLSPVQISGFLAASLYFAAAEQQAAVGPPVAIDHPPQLA